MKKYIALTQLALLVLTAPLCSFGQFDLENRTAEDLVRNVLLGGNITVENIQFTGHSEGGIAGFSNGENSNIGLSSGILLTTGPSEVAIGPNDDDEAGENVTGGGYLPLDELAGATTEDAAILEFDFTPEQGNIEFRYIFASEEYPEYVCSRFNDAFGFFISGPNPVGGSYTQQNIALIEGTILPVTINSVNGGIIGDNGNSGDCISLEHSDLFVNNPEGVNTTVQYDGFTVVLTARANVVPGQTYHITIAVADASDGALDSGVFLEAGSFSSSPPPPCTDCISSFAPKPGEKYVLSAWVSEDNANDKIAFDNPVIDLVFEGASQSIRNIRATGPVIDGWQKIEKEFTVPENTTSISFELVNNGTADVYFDDIRLFPFDANMKSFVYDPETLRLMAELDENNFATFYEYDEEGALVRVKKETERGVMTIQESRNSTQKAQ